MVSTYPGALDTFVDPTSSTDEVVVSHALQHTHANDAVLAVETELGVNPRGSAADLATRLAATDVALTLISRLTPTFPPKTANYTAAANDLVLCDTTAGAITITLSTPTVDKTTIGIKLTAFTSALTVAASGSDTFNTVGGSVTLGLSTNRQAMVVQYSLASHVWVVVDDSLSLAQLDARYTTPTALTAAVLVESNRATTAEGVNATAITTETTRATAAEGANTTSLASVKAGRVIAAPIIGMFQVFQGISNGTDTGVNTMKKHVLPTGIGLETFVLRYGNWNATGAGENDGASVVTFSVAVGLSTVGPWFPVTKNGSPVMVLSAGAVELETDPITLSVLPGGTLYEKVFASPAASGFWSATGTVGSIGTTFWCSHSNGESDLHLSTAAFTPATGTRPFASNGLVSLTMPSTTASTFIPGDSIAGGQGDAVIANGGWPYYAFQGLRPFQRAPVSGSKLTDFINPVLGRRRSSLARGCNVYFDAYGPINDLTTGRTLAQIQADLLTGWFSASRRGMKVLTTTQGPVTTTTDNWLTVANQTVVASNSVRVLLNNWKRDGSPILAGVAVAAGSSAGGTLRAGMAGHPLSANSIYTNGCIEFADAVESSRDSGKYAVNARARTISDWATTSGSGTVTSATAAFTSADNGAAIFITGAVTANYNVTTYVNATTMTVSPVATATVSAAAGSIWPWYGTLDGTHPTAPLHHLMANAINLAGIDALVA